MDLFSQLDNRELQGTPLAEKLRPANLQEMIGQTRALSQIKKFLENSFLPSMIFWGPPGTGKTSLGLALAKEFQAHFEAINAVDSGAKILKELGEQSRMRRRMENRRTILFVDEIHRFNKAQQDVLLPFIEQGDFTLIGATTENPSYELNKALLSRSRIIVFERLLKSDLQKLLTRSLEKFSIPEKELFEDSAQQSFLAWVDGDARKMLSVLEELMLQFQTDKAQFPLSETALQDILGRFWMGYDKHSDQHYDSISAFIKSIRGSDADAALYYLARMLKGGEDPVFIARRLVILASEDVGNADPRALGLAVAGAQAVELIGMPEAAINLAQVVTYMASAPKSNRSYLAIKKAQSYVESSGSLAIPKALRSSQTQEMKQLGHGQGYKYPHDYPKHHVQQNYWPENTQPQKFYEPSEIGFEKQIKQFADWLKS